MNDLDQIITGFDVWHCEIPVNSRRDHGIGAVEGSCEAIFLRLTAEGGATGWGEASPWVVFTGSPEASFAALNRYFRPLTLGRKVADRAQIMATAQRAVAHCTEAKAALETALLDLTGQITDLPVHALLGGKTQDRIPLSCSIANPDFEADKALLERLEADNVKIVKLKAGFTDHTFDVMRCEYIRQSHPSLALRVDYNQGLTPEEAPGRTADIATFAPDFIEQPVRHDQWRMMAKLRQSLPVPLLADESVFGPEDAERAIKENIADGLSIKIMKSGSLTRAQHTARIAATAGLSAYGGDMFETGLAHLAGTHMIAATPEITLGCEFYQAKYYLTEDLLEDPFAIANGEVLVPDTPGLGARPNLDKIQRMSRK